MSSEKKAMIQEAEALLPGHQQVPAEFQRSLETILMPRLVTPLLSMLSALPGLRRDAIAELLGLPVHEVRQKWTYARAWLRVAIEEGF